MEYEEVLLDQLEELRLNATDVGDLLDYLCSVGKQQQSSLSLAAVSKDPKDDLILEAAVAGSYEAIITYNRRDFRGAQKFGVRILTPEEVS